MPVRETARRGGGWQVWGMLGSTVLLVNASRVLRLEGAALFLAYLTAIVV
jgi:hypothetical protein